MSLKEIPAKYKAIKKTLAAALATTFMATIATCIYFDVHYAYTMPQAPQPQTGRIYPISVLHGSRVYVNKQELAHANFVFHELFNVATVSFFLLFFLIADLRELWRRARAGPRPPDAH
ncbi:MAG TPA: hypothetical protein VNM47_19390 [Terriglobia bacterium]|nr:hypothetical protein [Terriglobia bacterium]